MVSALVSELLPAVASDTERERDHFCVVRERERDLQYCTEEMRRNAL